VEPRLGRLGQIVLAFVLMAPALILLAGLFFYPLAVVVYTSLSGPQGVSLAHYAKFFSDERSYAALMNTIKIAVLSTVGCVLISLPLALLLRRSRRYRAFMRTLITLPLMVPVLIASYALTLFFARNGLFNYLIVRVLHLASERLTISYTLTGVILACVWRYFPFVAIVVSGALESLNPSLEEAAASLGASPMRAFRDVILPLLVPSIVTGSILAFVGTFGTFSIPLIMGRGEEVLAVLAYRYEAVFFDSGSASTVAVVMIVVQALLLTAFARLLRGRVSWMW
jgi:putative spermidine/putrescine transport system permease protein